MQAIRIRSADVSEENVVVLELSDGSTVRVTLEQILEMEPAVQAEGELDPN